MGLEGHQDGYQVLVVGQPRQLQVLRIGTFVNVIEAKELGPALAEAHVRPVAHVHRPEVLLQVRVRGAGQGNDLPPLSIPHGLLPGDAGGGDIRVRVVPLGPAIWNFDTSVDPGIPVVVGVPAPYVGHAWEPYPDRPVIEAVDAPSLADYGPAELAGVAESTRLVDWSRRGPVDSSVHAAGVDDVEVLAVGFQAHGPDREQIASWRVVDEDVIGSLRVVRRRRGQEHHQVGIGASPVVRVGLLGRNGSHSHASIPACAPALSSL